MQKIVEWKPGTQANISQSHKDRVCTFDNGSIQLFSVGVRDSGSYIVTVTERLGSSRFGTIVLHVSGETLPGPPGPLENWSATAHFLTLCGHPGDVMAPVGVSFS